MFQYIIENRIKAALENDDLECTQLKFWLAFANQGVFDPEICWNYTFSNDQSLGEYVVYHSNLNMQAYVDSDKTEQEYLFAAQDFLKRYSYLKDVQTKAQNLFEVAPKGVLQTFFLIFINIFRSVGTFNSAPLTDKREVDRLDLILQQDIQNDDMGFAQHSPLIREQYTPQELLVKGVRITNPELVPTPVAAKPKTNELPIHLTPWVNDLSLQLQVDINQQRQQVLNERQQVTINADTALAHQSEVTQWIDDSKVQRSYLFSQTCKKADLTYPSMWLSSFVEAVKDFNNNKGQQQFLSEPASIDRSPDNQFEFYLSDTAQNILLAGGNTVRGYELAADIDLLPVGFFIERRGHVWTLKFNAEYREWQLKNQKDVGLLLDPAACLPSSDNLKLNNEYKTRAPATQADFLKELKRQKINLTGQKLKLIESINKNLFPSFESGIKEQVFSSLIWIAQESAHPGHILKILDRLLDFEPVAFNYSRATQYPNWLSNGDNSLLYFFLRYHLVWINNGNAFDNPLQMEHLSRLAKLSYDELAWFGKLSKKDCSKGAPEYYNFDELCKGVFCFIDYFESHGIPLPKVERSTEQHKMHGTWYQDPLTEIKSLLDCISMLHNNKNMQRLQTRFFKEMPLDIAIAKAQLRAGYNFVHHSMCFDSSYIANATLRKRFNTKFPQLTNPFLISPEEFADIAYINTLPKKDDAIYYRALYFRFIALNVDPNAMEEAINAWEKITGTEINTCQTLWADTEHQSDFIELKRGVSNNWEAIKSYALNLPRKNRVDDTTTYVPESLVNELLPVKTNERFIDNHQHADTDVHVLINKLSLSSTIALELPPQIDTLNKLIDRYHSMSPTDLDAALQNAGQASMEERIALLRETYYRLSRTEKNNHEGEWLRLEQLVVLLISLKNDALFQVETSEGKTLIIQFMALLKALDNKKVTIITHNESLAEKAADSLKALGALLKLNVSSYKDSDETINESAIHYVDIANAVLNDRLSRLNNTKTIQDKETVAIIDEVDNIVIDVYANTTMQISRGNGEASQTLIAFLIALNTVVRTQLAKSTSTCLAEHRFLIRRAIETQAYYQQANLEEDDNLDFWIKAAVSSMQCHIKSDYVINVSNSEEKVQIVHKDTTGRVDHLSQWSEGVHHCVAAWERMNGHPNIVIPGLNEVIAEGDIAAYLQENFLSRCALTGTIGEEPVKQVMAKILQTELIVEIPRAKRPTPKDAAWPKMMDKTKPDEPPVDVYNRSYHFPPIYTKNNSEHFAKILEGLKNAHKINLSCLVFFNTIAECDDFYTYLLEHNFTNETLSNYIQILDDTSDPLNAAIRPSEETIIERAKEKKMITLTTAAGSRGTDFEGIDVGINAKPALGRVIIQKGGRIGRNGSFGVFYEIYNEEDLQSGITNSSLAPDTHNLFRKKLEQYEIQKQARDLHSITSRAQQRENNQKLQNEYFKIRTTVSDDKKEALENAWCGFFKTYGRMNDNTLTLEQKIEQFQLHYHSLN